MFMNFSKDCTHREHMCIGYPHAMRVRTFFKARWKALSALNASRTMLSYLCAQTTRMG